MPLVSLLGWLMVAFLGFVMASKSIRRWTGPGGEIEEIHGSHLPEIIGGGAMVALSCYFLGVGLGLGGGATKTAGSQVGAFEYSAPNAPTITTLTVVDTSTVWVQGSAFVGSGDDTQDSIWIAITRVGADTTAIIAQVLGGAQTRDTVASNDSLKADTTYRAWLKYKGAAAKSAAWSAWSAPDTFTNRVLTSGAIDTIVVVDWGTALGQTDSARTDGGALGFALACGGSTPDSIAKVIEGDTVNYANTDNILRIIYHTNGCWHAGTDNMFPAIQAGDVWVYSIDFANGVGQNFRQQHGNLDHHFQHDSDGPIEASMDVFPIGSLGNWRHIIAYGERLGGSGGPRWWNEGDTLLADTMYTLHFRLEWVTDTTYRVYPDLYKASDGTHLAGPNDYECFSDCETLGRGLLDWYALGADTVHQRVTTSLQNIRDLAWGQSQAIAPTNKNFYYGCFRAGTSPDTASYWPAGSC